MLLFSPPSSFIAVRVREPITKFTPQLIERKSDIALVRTRVGMIWSFKEREEGRVKLDYLGGREKNKQKKERKEEEEEEEEEKKNEKGRAKDGGICCH